MSEPVELTRRELVSGTAALVVATRSSLPDAAANDHFTSLSGQPGLLVYKEQHLGVRLQPGQQRTCVIEATTLTATSGPR
jgi:hypothetical protein